MRKEDKRTLYLEEYKGIIEHLFVLNYTVNIHETHALNVAGKSLSTSSTSRLIRLIILPSGVVSKNDVGARIMRYNKLLCK